VFANRLASEMASALRGKARPAGFNPESATANPEALKSLPAGLHAAIVHAYALALQPVFLIAVPIALVAFALSWFLREVPVRAAAGPPDIGESLGATAPGRSSADEVERALSRLASADIRRRGYERLAALAGLDLPAGSCWVLTRLAKQGAVAGEELARQAGIEVGRGRTYLDRLVAERMVVRANGTLILTPSGSAAADRLFAARREGLRELLADWSPEQHAELADLLNRLSRAILGENADRGLISR
jgi:DNA-binding MarR family transcriptional regulator